MREVLGVGRTTTKVMGLLLLSVATKKQTRLSMAGAEARCSGPAGPRQRCGALQMEEARGEGEGSRGGRSDARRKERGVEREGDGGRAEALWRRRERGSGEVARAPRVGGVRWAGWA